MAEIDRQAVILDAIDSLRRRKARPDLERICHMVERKYGLTDVDVITELDRLVDDEIVIKVDYKGNTSYRNAAKWCKSRLGGHQLNSNDATRSILAAIEKLTVPKDSDQVLEDADCPSNVQPKNDNALKGASLEEIVKFFAEENPDTKFTRNYLEEALKREVGSRRLYISPTNKYVLAKYAVTYEEGEAFQLKRGPRPPKRKRIKKTHGPDFEQEPLIKTSMWDQRCDYCSLPASCNKFGAKEELLVCKDCSLKVHPSCMKYTRQLAERSRLSPWQCIDCKTCHVCNDAGDADTLLFCDSCDKGYHMACHNPIVEEKPLGKWVCELCASEDMEIGSNITDEDSVMSSEASVGSNTEEKNNSAENGSTSQTSGQVTPDVATPNQSRVANLPVQSAQANTSSSPPEISLPMHPAHWSLDDVVKFLQEKGFKDEADTFKDQEIDGHALLLLRRSDVLTGLSFKLGPALKIYQIVSKLQLSQAKDSPINAKTKSSLQTTTSKASSSSSASSAKSKPSTSSTKAPQPKKPKKEASAPKPSSPPNRPSETAKKTTQPKSATRAKDISPKTQPQPAKATLANSPPKSKGSPANSASQSENSTPTPPDVSPKTEAKSPRKSSTSSRTTP